MEVSIVNSATTATTIEKLRAMFATHGLPRTVVSDNGSVFTSSDFEQFMLRNGIRHIRTAPYHPASNGLAERAIQTLKEGLKKLTSGCLETKLSRFLFQYRITPHTTTGQTPAQLLMGRCLHSHLDQLLPDLTSHVQNKQMLQKERFDQHTKTRHFLSDEPVFIRYFGQGDTWLAGIISKSQGPRTYDVKLPDNRVLRRHVDHIRPRSVDQNIQPTDSDDTLDDPIPIPTSSDDVVPPPTLRRSTRVSRPPNRLVYFI